MMRIPFANRTVDVTLPIAPAQAKVRVKAVMDEFKRQTPVGFRHLFEAFVLLSPHDMRVTCKTAMKLGEFCHLGLTFRDNLVVVWPCKTVKWVNLTRLSYGISNEALHQALQPYGKILHIKMDQYQGVYVGVRNILLENSKPIPSSLRVVGHWCNIFYPGQIPTCFSCRQAGHTRANCPHLVRDQVSVSPVEHLVDPVDVAAALDAVIAAVEKPVSQAPAFNNQAPPVDSLAAPMEGVVNVTYANVVRAALLVPVLDVADLGSDNTKNKGKGCHNHDNE